MPASSGNDNSSLTPPADWQPGARNPFSPKPAKDQARFNAINDTIQRDQEHGRLRLRGVALAYWVAHAPTGPLKAWVMDQLDRRIDRSGWHYTSIGYVRSGAIDIGRGHSTGMRIVGRMGLAKGEALLPGQPPSAVDREVDRIAFLTTGTPTNQSLINKDFNPWDDLEGDES